MRVFSSCLLICGLLFIIFIPELSAQNRDFGDVQVADFFQYDQSYDTSASAIVLFDIGNVYFDADYNVILNRHTRIKILNESGLKYADVQILFDRKVGQRVNDIKAASYLINQGELEERDIGRRDIYEEKLVDDIYEKKFTLPNVKKGSIIEYSYEKVMGNPFQMPDWEFHKEIPVAYSSIYMKIPWRFNYHLVFKGTDTLYTTRSGNYGGTAGQNYYNYGDDRGYFVEITKEDLPPVKDLPFMDSRDDFISEVYTQLNYAYRDNGNKIEYLENWEQISDEIRKHPDIGKQRVNRAIREKVKALTESATSDEQKITQIFDFVSANFEWNGLHRLYSEKGIIDTFKEKSGSSGDLNILLAKMLKEAGIKVYYGLTSTRDHGDVLLDYPIVNQFNNFIAVAEMDGYLIVLDATEGSRSLLLPPLKDLFQVTMVIKEDSYGWMETRPYQRSETREMLTYKINISGEAEATYTHTNVGYPAQLLRRKIEASGKQQITDEIFRDLDPVTIDTVVTKGMENSNSTAVLYSKFYFDVFRDSLSEVSYLNPMLFLAEKENQFDSPKREFPVEFPYPLKQNKDVSITLPDGFVVEETPEPVNYILPENGGSFSFQIQVLGSMINISSELDLRKSTFKNSEYESLRELFLTLIKKHSGSIVIKKSK
ncbi:DUF3857 domain-containing protein [Gracilimonas tropica]|uniref:DUF3857 domain-containing protein n=1 Tax=Gracilimonas tropica TaxID=454600 RepID=UPI00037E1E85|nr:DUF3857 domain-containing protein [Gracilimonas tropica]